MTPSEVSFCLSMIDFYVAHEGLDCVDNYRAARMWKSAQVRRFRKLEEKGCCGSATWIVSRFNWKKFRFDKYLIGCNYGH